MAGSVRGDAEVALNRSPQGNVRRRFIGARSLAVFEAMVREAGRE
jgi:hypothetical protein